MRWISRASLLSLLLPTAPRLLGAQQVTNQLFEVIPRAAHATVGDTISLAFRVRLDPLDLLYDTAPEPPSDLPEGVRILAIEKLHRGRNREWIGRAQVAFYRLGRQPSRPSAFRSCGASRASPAPRLAAIPHSSRSIRWRRQATHR